MRELNVSLCSEKCPATKEKWRCERCAELIGDTFDIIIANGGGLKIPMTDFFIRDFQYKKRYDKDISIEARNREELLSEAADGCPHRALSIEVY